RRQQPTRAAAGSMRSCEATNGNARTTTELPGRPAWAEPAACQPAALEERDLLVRAHYLFVLVPLLWPGSWQRARDWRLVDGRDRPDRGAVFPGASDFLVHAQR